jgi:hypothetical protein
MLKAEFSQLVFATMALSLVEQRLLNRGSRSDNG